MAFPADRPTIIVNYKTYVEATGRRAVELTHALEKAAEGARATVVVAPQAADLHRVASSTRLVVIAQHADALLPGAGTGATLPEAIREAGASGSLLNHAERRLQLADIAASASRLHALGLSRVVCTDTVSTTRAAASLLHADLVGTHSEAEGKTNAAAAFVAIEPPELIGGDVSVTSADPAIVRDAVLAAKAVSPHVRVLCGAGVKTGADLRAALELGAHGVLLASGVVKAKDPGAAFRSLLSGILP